MPLPLTPGGVLTLLSEFQIEPILNSEFVSEFWILLSEFWIRVWILNSEPPQKSSKKSSSHNKEFFFRKKNNEKKKQKKKHTDFFQNFSGTPKLEKKMTHKNELNFSTNSEFAWEQWRILNSRFLNSMWSFRALMGQHVRCRMCLRSNCSRGIRP